MNAPTLAPNSYRAQPDERGHFGDFGGRYVAETLMPVSYTHLTLPTILRV